MYLKFFIIYYGLLVSKQSKSTLWIEYSHEKFENLDSKAFLCIFIQQSPSTQDLKQTLLRRSIYVLFLE